MSGEMFTLRECLVEFLNEGIQEMPQIEAQIISFEPFQITDTGNYYFEITSLQDELSLDFLIKPEKSYKLVIIDWKFIFKRVPNSHEYYIDLKADNYKVVETDNTYTPSEHITNIMDDVDIKFLYERKRKRAVEGTLDSNIKVLSPFKGKYMNKNKFGSQPRNHLGSPQFGNTSGNIYSNGEIGLSDMMGSRTFQKSDKGTPLTLIRSPIRTPTKTSGIGHKKRNDIYNRYGHWNKNVGIMGNNIQEVKQVLGKRNPEENQTENSKIKIDDLFEGFRKKKLKWNQIEFNKETVEYLKENIKSLLK